MISILILIFENVDISKHQIIEFSVDKVHHEYKLPVRTYFLIVDGCLLFIEDGFVSSVAIFFVYFNWLLLLSW